MSDGNLVCEPSIIVLHISNSIGKMSRLVSIYKRRTTEHEKLSRVSEIGLLLSHETMASMPHTWLISKNTR